MEHRDYEKLARAAGWSEFRDTADDTMLMVASRKAGIDITFSGPDRWREAVAHEQASPVKPLDSLWMVYRASDGELHYQSAEDLQECGTPIDPETDEEMDLIGWETKGAQPSTAPATAPVPSRNVTTESRQARQS